MTGTRGGADTSIAEMSRSMRILTTELRKLHIRAGEPSTREIASAIGGMSHSTVNNAIRGKKLPSWPVLAKIVKQLGGDENLFRGLWAATREEGIPSERLPTPVSAHRPEISVFVSYASIDERATRGRVQDIVNSVRDQYESLTGVEVGVFLDKSSLAAGDNWRDTIRFELSSSAIFLAFLSPSYIRSVECNNEFWEFYRFLEANSNDRLMIPLLFGERARTANADPKSELWAKANELHMLDISALRSVDPEKSVWLEKTQEIAERIDAVLSAIEVTAHRAQAVATESDEEITPMLLEQMLQFEDAAPMMLVTLESLKDGLYKVGNQVGGAGPILQRATTTKRRLAVARQLARSIDPIADEVVAQVEAFISNLRDWDVTVRTVFDYLHRQGWNIASGDVTALDTLNAIKEMANTGVEVFGEAEGLHEAIGQGRGLARELDEPLKKLQSASLKLADSRAIFTTWTVGAKELLQSDGL